MKKKIQVQLMLSLLLFFTTSIFAQSNKINFIKSSYTLEELIEVIEQQSSFSFVVSEDQIDLEVIISNISSSDDVKEILKKIEASLGGSRVSESGNIVSIVKSEETNKVSKKVVRGQLKDEEGNLLPGGTVRVPNTSIGTITDIDGGYSMEVPSNVDSLTFSFIGYQNKVMPILFNGNVNAVLSEDNITLKEVAVVGYGVQSKVKVTGSITGIKSSDIEDLPVPSFDEALAGKNTGVQVVQNSGAPGSSSTIRIRGISTITAGSNPLVVLDGLPLEDGNTTDINPNDIESIEILKDAASAAIYGSRGGNGVILITTKKGADLGKTIYNFNTYIGVQEVTH